MSESHRQVVARLQRQAQAISDQLEAMTAYAWRELDDDDNPTSRAHVENVRAELESASRDMRRAVFWLDQETRNCDAG